MFTSNFLNQFSLTSLTIVSTLVSSAFADNGGGGYNGPQLAGVSIPVMVDRAISTQAIKSAVETCLITGDKARGVQSLLESMMVQGFGYAPGSFRLSVGAQQNYLQEWTIDRTGSTYVSEIECNGCTSGFISGVKFWKQPRIKGEGLADPDHQGLRLGEVVELLPAAKARGESAPPMSVPMMFNLNLPGRYWVENYPITSARLPNLSYDEVVTEAVVDDFGNVITQKLVKGIRVTVDADFATHGDRVEFVASLTRKPIAAKANFQAYVQCLGNELSK